MRKMPTPERMAERAQVIREHVENLQAVKGKVFANSTHAIANLMILEHNMCKQLAGSPLHDYMHAAVNSIITSMSKCLEEKDIEECVRATEVVLDLSSFR